MEKKLVIVESPAKAKTINKILGDDFIVASSMGHVCDLPVKSLGIDIENDFEPEYVVVPGRKKIVEQLRKAVLSCDEVFLAPDPDREGEAIAWHLYEVLKDRKPGLKFFRVQYNEITARAVRAAFEKPGTLNRDRVNAQQARRVIDRIVGYKVSPMLWRKLQRGLSAGRVQSVALRLLCEREEEIEQFVPEIFFVIGARARKYEAPLDEFTIRLARINGEKSDVKDGAQAQGILEDLTERQLRVASIRLRTVAKKAPPPFITSTLQQSGSSRYGYSPSRTMSLAQKLYEGVDFGQGPVGLITYMRTDSVAVARDAQEACRRFVTKTFGATYCPEKPNVFHSRAGAQEAHEAIRPTDVELTPELLSTRIGAQELKLYDLIWRRFVASQMAAASIEQRLVEISAEPDSQTSSVAYQFQASASEVLFPGYMKASGSEAASAEKDKDEDDPQSLPPLKEGEMLECLEWLSEEKQTKPPSRFSEASLVRELEKNGVGRPSTYAQILSTLSTRRYALREKRSLSPTTLGRSVNELLVRDLNALFNVEFTAHMEEELDDIEEGRVEWKQMIRGFYKQFELWMEGTKAPAADRDKVVRLLSSLENVTEWLPPTTRGKRKYDDKKFVLSLQTQLEKGEKPVSERQLEALARIACRYCATYEELDAVIRDCGFEKLLESGEAEPPRETTLLKLKALDALDLDERGRSFVDSLASRVESGRRLSDAQLRALDSMVRGHAGMLENFEALCLEVGIDATPAASDPECEALLDVLSGVKKWNEAVKRGKRVFDDKAFFESVAEQFRRKGSLSDRQKAAMKRLVVRYREQLASFDELAVRFGLSVADKDETKNHN